VYDSLEERPIRAHASQHADSEQNAEQMSGKFLLASKPTPGHNTSPVPQA
jgi:hypothetical protein